MRITLQPYSGGEFTAQDDAEHIDRVIDMFKGLLGIMIFSEFKR